MILTLLPLLVVFVLFPKKLEKDEVLVCVIYTLYALSVSFLIEIPTNSRIGSLFAGLPSGLFLAYLYPSFVDLEEKITKAVASILFVIIALWLGYFTLFVF
ncbi:hypothetical protein [Vibrio hippocampi]|uniref:Uncharacterized protein n=1 Tax=Vibrio hippocampi TaxID=654686 RepID=A0ABN8DQ71_9VIBR|nr:hypothetical protein [Vibrio hippocampi]CAH0530322.1 hypothetical protein VHP8226_03963 [Vibrio hippocampi]